MLVVVTFCSMWVLFGPKVPGRSIRGFNLAAFVGVVICF